jgi:hypothetical protein
VPTETLEGAESLLQSLFGIKEEIGLSARFRWSEMDMAATPTVKRVRRMTARMVRYIPRRRKHRAAEPISIGATASYGPTDVSFGVIALIRNTRRSADPLGRTEYLPDCARCHGVDGKGGVPQMRAAPGYTSVDLTRLTDSNGGRFPRFPMLPMDAKRWRHRSHNNNIKRSRAGNGGIIDVRRKRSGSVGSPGIRRGRGPTANCHFLVHVGDMLLDLLEMIGDNLQPIMQRTGLRVSK